MSGSRVPREVWISLLTGLCWLTLGARAGMGTFFLCLPPGLLLATSGVNRLISPGDERMVQVMALGACAGVLLGLPAIFGLGLGSHHLVTRETQGAFRPVVEGQDAAGGIGQKDYVPAVFQHLPQVFLGFIQLLIHLVELLLAFEEFGGVLDQAVKSTRHDAADKILHENHGLVLKNTF